MSPPVYSKFMFFPQSSKFKTFNEECFSTYIKILIGMLNKWVNCVFSAWPNRKLCVLGFLTDRNVFRGEKYTKKLWQFPVCKHAFPNLISHQIKNKNHDLSTFCVWHEALRHTYFWGLEYILYVKIY